MNIFKKKIKRINNNYWNRTQYSILDKKFIHRLGTHYKTITNKLLDLSKKSFEDSSNSSDQMHT